MKRARIGVLHETLLGTLCDSLPLLSDGIGQLRKGVLSDFLKVCRNYRVTILVGENLLLTLIWDVLSSCLGSRQFQ